MIYWSLLGIGEVGINSDYSVTEPINFCTADHFLSLLAMKVDQNPANAEAVDS